MDELKRKTEISHEQAMLQLNNQTLLIQQTIKNS